MPEFLLRESDFTFDVDLFNGFMYDLHLYGVKLTTFDIKDRSIKIIPGENEPRAVMEIGGTHLKGHLTGGLEIGKFQMFNFTNIEIQGLYVRFELGIENDANNKPHWRVVGASQIDFDDLHVRTNSEVLNNVLEMFHGIIVKFLRSYENGYGSLFNTVLNDYNNMLRAQSEFYIAWPDPSHHKFNTTMVGAPEINADTQLISFGFDGTIYDSHLRTNHVNRT